MINTFFSDWFVALQFSISQASQTIEPIVTRLDPIKKASFGFDDLLSALTAGLAFLGTPALGGSVASAAGSAFTTGVQQAPGVGKAVWPSGTTDVGKLQSHIIADSDMVVL